MTPAELRNSIDALFPGHGGQTRLASELNVNSRRVRAWLTGEEPVPEWAEREIDAWAQQFPGGVQVARPGPSIRLVIAGLERQGFSRGEAAAAVLAVARTEAVAALGRDAVDQMLAPARREGAEWDTPLT